MMIIGCDYHPGFQQIAFVDTETGELQERRLGHREEAEKFYRRVQPRIKEFPCGSMVAGQALHAPGRLALWRSCPSIDHSGLPKR
jgi:hypothetical protein